MFDSLALTIRQRTELWDAVLQAIRQALRHGGMREVVTPVRVRAPAVEPYIEPLASPPRWLVTSPELAMKVLLAHGSGPIFQIGPVFRAEEEGPRHREEFHLLEWYRLGDCGAQVRKDVEAVVECVGSAIEGVFGSGVARGAPSRWQTVEMLSVVAETMGIRLHGEESALELEAAVQSLGWSLAAGPGVVSADLADDPDVAALAAWTAFFSVWSAERLPGWLDERRGDGVHVVDFPPSLAALARCDVGPTGALRARRFESHVGGIELANGYEELTDAIEQRRRFERVNRLRVALGRQALPLDEEFLTALGHPGLPPCSGAALGLERLIALVCGVPTFDDILLELPRCD